MNKSRVIIIGAGMAGISAADHLVKNGINDVIILEASGRIGGRIWTEEFGNGLIELGATWIHGGSPGNCVYNLANTYNYLGSNLLLDEKKGHFFSSDGTAISPHFGTQVYGSCTDMLETIDLPMEPGGETLNDYIQKIVAKVIQPYAPKYHELAKSIINNFRNSLAHNMGDDLGNISAWSYASFQDIPGEDIKIPVGYSKLLKSLATHLPLKALHFNHEVESIKWGIKDNSPIEITCSNGRTFKGDYAIITISLGVLKDLSSTLFSPRLPLQKLEVIERTGFGRVCKIFLYYEHPFWQPGKLNRIHFVWTDHERQNPQNLKHHWIIFTSGFEEIHNNPTVLVGWIAGNHAKLVEELPEDEIAEACSIYLSRFLKDPSIPRPSKVCRSRWICDPYCRGAYSYTTTKNLANDRDILSQPLPDHLNPCLLFAGEATQNEFYGTTHAARLSGLREAERIIIRNNEYK